MATLTIKDGNNASQTFFENTDVNGNLVTSVSTEGQKATYSAGSAGVTLAASATDVVTITGSASKVIRVTGIRLSGIATTALTTSVSLYKRTVADTSGTSTTATIVKNDTNDAAPTAVVTLYTANPTVGSGALARSQQVSFTLATGTIGAVTLYEFAVRNERAMVLRGVNEQLAISLEGVTVSGGKLSFDVTWTEE